MNLAERLRDAVRRFARWLAARSPHQLVLAGWVVFFLASYPGYMSFESTMQLFAVRSGAYDDTYPPLVTGVWSLFDHVFAGPFPMLVLQSGLFLFGLAAVLRTMLSPRAAALTAVGVLLFPPVFAPMAVIWRESLMAGALLAATACALQPPRWKWRIAGAALLVLACACRNEIVLAIIPLVLLAVPQGAWWRRAAIGLALSIGIASAAWLGNSVLTNIETHGSQQALMVADIFGTFRRAQLIDETRVRTLLDGLPLTAPDQLRAALANRRAMIDWWPSAHGATAAMDPIKTDEQSSALTSAWLRVLRSYPSGYLRHRWVMTKYMLAVTGNVPPIYDSFGDPALIAPLRHRASASHWQGRMQSVVRLFEQTPVFWPWCYLALAIVALVLARGRPMLRHLLASGLVFELTMFWLAPSPDFRFSHWLVTTTCITVVVLAVSRRASWRFAAPGPSHAPSDGGA